MRWYILRTLLHKEVLRHWANRGGLALVVLLVSAALLLSFFGKNDGQTTPLLGGVQRCYIDYWQEGPWVEHLRQTLPAEWQGRVRFRYCSAVPTVSGVIAYEPNSGGIQLRTVDGTNGPRYKVWVWHPGAEGTGMALYEAWFWRESYRFLEQQSAESRPDFDPAEGPALASVSEERSQLEGTADPRSAIATALVLFGIFFVCVYLLPSLTCEERERGVLLAQALSPASPKEILAARFLFYPVVGMSLAALLAGIYQPAALLRPFFWLALLVATFGSMGIGLTISSLARSQRSASMGAMCYMLAVALLLVICQQCGIMGVPWLALEYHCPRMLQAVLAGQVQWYHWGNLAAAGVLAACWVVAATALFRRQGWQ